jgi:hypothetical protein
VCVTKHDFVARKRPACKMTKKKNRKNKW